MSSAHATTSIAQKSHLSEQLADHYTITLFPFQLPSRPLPQSWTFGLPLLELGIAQALDNAVFDSESGEKPDQRVGSGELGVYGFRSSVIGVISEMRRDELWRRVSASTGSGNRLRRMRRCSGLSISLNWSTR